MKRIKAHCQGVAKNEAMVRGTWLLFALATIVLTTMIHFYVALFIPPTKEKVWKEVQVSEGMSLKAIAGTLKKEGIIRYRGYFEIVGRLQGFSRKVRVGYYGLNTNSMGRPRYPAEGQDHRV
jgi:cell division protein YceG involved in septum cleavage